MTKASDTGRQQESEAERDDRAETTKRHEIAQAWAQHRKPVTDGAAVAEVPFT
jgi:hypothetical protein